MDSFQASGSELRDPAVAMLSLSGRWRWLPFYPVVVMIAITVFVVLLARDMQTGWLVPAIVSPAWLVALLIAHDMRRMRLWIGAEGIGYRGVGYTLQAPWAQVDAARTDRSFTAENPSVKMSGWFGILFAAARGWAPAHHGRAASSMRTIPVYCFDGAELQAALARHAPAGLAASMVPARSYRPVAP